MKAEHLLQANLLDIVFENRNKDYGAYQLRKDYALHVYKSLVIIISGVVIIVLYLSFLTPEIQGRVFQIPGPEIGRIPEVPKELLPAIPPKKKSGESTIGKSRSNIVVTSTGPVDIITEPGSAFAGPVEVIGTTGSGPETPAANPEQTSVVDSIVPFLDRNEPLDVADIMPAFPGGMKALTKFLERNLTQPENISDIAKGHVVSVKVKFIVGYDGKLKGFYIIEDGGELFNKEVLRVLKKMPDWIPGKAKGENVSVWYTIPVKFMSTE